MDNKDRLIQYLMGTLAFISGTLDVYHQACAEGKDESYALYDSAKKQMEQARTFYNEMYFPPHVIEVEEI